MIVDEHYKSHCFIKHLSHYSVVWKEWETFGCFWPSRLIGSAKEEASDTESSEECLQREPSTSSICTRPDLVGTQWQQFQQINEWQPWIHKKSSHGMSSSNLSPYFFARGGTRLQAVFPRGDGHACTREASSEAIRAQGRKPLPRTERQTNTSSYICAEGHWQRFKQTCAALAAC